MAALFKDSLFTARIIPELQNRGIFKTEYSGDTLRERLGLNLPRNPLL